jgi:hypothetical protein
MTNQESDNRILTFKSICNLIKDLNDSFGKQQKSLLLYAALIEKTGIMHEEPIKKHISIFYNFIKENEEFILEKDEKKFKSFRINYSDKVGVDFEQIFQLADSDEKQAIFNHLLTLLAILDPSSAAKEVLKKEIEIKKKQGEKPTEEHFLKNIINKVNDQMDDNIENPLQLMNKMMSSGVFSEIVENMNTSLNNGDLDLGKMMSSIQMVMNNLGGAFPNVSQNSSESA